MDRQSVSTGTEWESIVGYSRAVRVGPQVYVSGTTATDDSGELVGEGDPARQMRQTLSNLEEALDALGANVSDVVRTRIFVTDMDHWEAIGRVHGEVFGDVRPATSMVEVSGLIERDMLVEVEAVAIVDAE